MLYRILEKKHFIKNVSETKIFTNDAKIASEITGASEDEIKKMKDGDSLRNCGTISDFDIYVEEKGKNYVTVDDVLQNIYCGFLNTPIYVYNCVGKDHTEFEYGDIAEGKIHPEYLKERIKYWEQQEIYGTVSIVLQ